MKPLQLRKKRIEAKRHRNRARRIVGDENMARIEAAARSFMEEEGNAESAAKRFEPWFRSQYGWVVEITLFLNLIVAVLAILQHFGYLSPSPDQYESVFEVNEE